VPAILVVSSSSKGFRQEAICSIPSNERSAGVHELPVILRKLFKHYRESLWRIPMALLEMVRLEEADRNIKVYLLILFPVVRPLEFIFLITFHPSVSPIFLKIFSSFYV
jgi:hypothetical protein